MVSNYIVPSHYSYHSSISSSKILSYKSTSIILNGEKYLFPNINYFLSTPGTKMEPVLCIEYWPRIINEIKENRNKTPTYINEETLGKFYGEIYIDM